jgi:hypothetical protein
MIKEFLPIAVAHLGIALALLVWVSWLSVSNGCVNIDA